MIVAALVGFDHGALIAEYVPVDGLELHGEISGFGQRPACGQ
ncbi:hypothetical protein ACW9HW_04830 [Pseudomonas sp. SDO5532_S415]